jgi:hypothetical protein
MNLKNVSSEELIAITETEIRVERASTLKIIKLFQEIYDRKIYLERGYSSFYDMATKQFGYCNGSAMRRIQAMKLVREIPQFEDKLESGELSLSVAADVQSFLQQEAKSERPYSINAKIELVQTCLGKSRREAEEEFARRNPEREKRESIHAISHDRLRVNLTISKDLNDKINRLKDLLSHVDPAMTTETLLERLTELGLDKHDPQRSAARAQARKARAAHSPAKAKDATTQIARTAPAEVRHTRYVPAQEKHAVAYDGNGCAFEANGRRCGSTKFRQLDHVKPYSEGGPNTAANLRWMCASHNRWRARQTNQ